jgi:hypothetical protein
VAYTRIHVRKVYMYIYFTPAYEHGDILKGKDIDPLNPSVSF